MLLVFNNSKNLNCFETLSTLSFYDSKRSIGEKSFFFK